MEGMASLGTSHFDQAPGKINYEFGLGNVCLFFH
jgi:hypothetical protein